VGYYTCIFLFKIDLAGIPVFKIEAEQGLSGRIVSQIRIKPSMPHSSAVLTDDGLRHAQFSQLALQILARAGIVVERVFFNQNCIFNEQFRVLMSYTQ
jgi:hypothetical protein